MATTDASTGMAKQDKLGEISSTGLLDLPAELLLAILACLNLSDFLNLTAVCKALHKPDYLYDSRYWSKLLHSTFRVPNQPLLRHGGTRAYQLYRRIHTQSVVFTWGSNGNAELGHTPPVPLRPGMTRAEAFRRQHISWPEKMPHVRDLGIIADLQCGGWSTTLLTSKGALHTVGVFDALSRYPTHPYTQEKKLEPTTLRYPPGFAHPGERYDASTAIKQFSSGRTHVLGLTDSGRIWSWQNVDQAALHVKFIHHDTLENSNNHGRGVVKKVVAGWNKSAALIEGVGIVIWEPIQRDNCDNELEDAALVLDSVVVPRSSFVRYESTQPGRAQQRNNPGTEIIGQVCNFIVLEDMIIFDTDLGKLFASEVVWNARGEMAGAPFELPLPQNEGKEVPFVTDVQGSFRSFGVFTRAGAVWTSTQARMTDFMKGKLGDAPLFTAIPALQHKDVAQLAFGDHHFHALHSSGHLTSYGNESQACGSLGLGGHGTPEGRLRGIRYQSAGGDGRLIPHAYTEGRRVWFEREKRAWIDFLTSGGVDPGEAQERVRMALGTPELHCQGEVSEWIEQQGRDWESKFGVQGDDDEELPAYFAMSVSAGGWHSGALVLENPELVERLRRACELPDPVTQASESVDSSSVPNLDQQPGLAPPHSIVETAIATGSDWGRWALGMHPYRAPAVNQQQHEPAGASGKYKRGMNPLDFGASPRAGYIYRWANDHFPRLRLRDGTEMPGEVPFDQWRYERPVWDLDFAL